MTNTSIYCHIYIHTHTDILVALGSIYYFLIKGINSAKESVLLIKKCLGKNLIIYLNLFAFSGVSLGGMGLGCFG